MICFLDRTFCEDPKCSCECPKWSEELSEQAERWWNPKDEPELRNQAPVCFIIHKGTTNDPG